MWSESSLQQTLPWPTLVGSYDRQMDTQLRMHFFPLWDRCVNAQRRATQPRAGGNPDMILRVGVGCCLWASSLLGTFRWCVATKYLTLKMSPGLEGVGCLQSLAIAGLPLHFLWLLSRDSSLSLDPKQAEVSGSTHLSALCLLDAPPTTPPPSLLSLMAALNAHHLSNLVDPKKEEFSEGAEHKGA